MTFVHTPWTDQEDSVVLRCIAEGKTATEIQVLIPHRTVGAVGNRLTKLKVRRLNLQPKPVFFRREPAVEPDRWFVKVKFEDITPAEARLISSSAPKSAPFRVHSKRPFSLYGSTGAMCTA